MTTRLERYWEKSRKGEALPDFHRFNAGVLQDIWPQCCVMSVSNRDVVTYRMEYVGDAVADMFGHSPKGKMVSKNLPAFAGSKVVIDGVDECVQRKVHCLSQGSFVNEKSKVVKYRSCILPFSLGGDVVEKIVVGISWRAF